MTKLLQTVEILARLGQQVKKTSTESAAKQESVEAVAPSQKLTRPGKSTPRTRAGQTEVCYGK